jgi:hypothetical protein
MRRSSRRRKNADLAKLVRETPLVDLATLASGIFALFALLGLVIDILAGGAFSPATVVRNTLLSGLVAVGYAFGAMRRNWWLFGATAVVQVLWFTVIGGGTIPSVPSMNLRHLRADAIGVIVLMSVAYAAFLGFINVTAARYIRVRAEVALAHDIHQVLVPAIDTRVGEYAFVGFSSASGDVGGDLVDVVRLGDEWFGCVADVSGHGVSSGVVMGMFKSALRMRLTQGGAMSSLLDDLNAVLHPRAARCTSRPRACAAARGARSTTRWRAICRFCAFVRTARSRNSRHPRCRSACSRRTDSRPPRWRSTAANCSRSSRTG